MIELFASRTVVVSVGNLSITWYGLLYVVAFWLAWAFLPVIAKWRSLSLSRDVWTTIVAYGALGVVAGGRLGYVLFYEPLFFLAHPLEIFAIWHGGMSSHGGFIGVGIALYLTCRSFHISWRSVADIVSPLAALGLMLGRIGNVINEEFGSYALYEAITDGLIALVCIALLRKTSREGVVFAAFLALYSIARFSLEYVRSQEWPILLGFSRGQLLTIPLFILAMILLRNALKQRI